MVVIPNGGHVTAALRRAASVYRTSGSRANLAAKLTHDAFPCDGNRHQIPDPTKIPVVVAVVPLLSQTSHNPPKASKPRN